MLPFPPSSRLLVFAVVAAGWLAACSSNPAKPNEPDFHPGHLFKTDIDRVVESHQREVFASAKRVMEKLYRRNPQEWKRAGYPSVEAAVARVFDYEHDFRFAELDNAVEGAALKLAFSEDFKGDRVLAYTVGLVTMFHAAFDYKREFYVLDSLDAQRMHNAARNVEIAVWQLSNKKNARGELFLLSNETEGKVRNLSFEREFGRTIGGLDTLARILAEKGQRFAVHVVQNFATAVFLPIK